MDLRIVEHVLGIVEVDEIASGGPVIEQKGNRRKQEAKDDLLPAQIRGVLKTPRLGSRIR
jgi:hypothetical protein